MKKTTKKNITNQSEMWTLHNQIYNSVISILSAANTGLHLERKKKHVYIDTNSVFRHFGTYYKLATQKC